MRKRGLLTTGTLCFVLFSFLALSGAAWAYDIDFNFSECEGCSNYELGVTQGFKFDNLGAADWGQTITYDPITIVLSATGQEFDWNSSGALVYCVIAKAGSGDAVVYEYLDGADKGFDLNAGISPASGSLFELSHVTFCYKQVPEPGTMALLGLGLIGLAGFGRKLFR